MMKTQSNQQDPKQGSTAKTIFLKVIPLVLTAWLAIYTLTMGIAVHKQVKTFQSRQSGRRHTLLVIRRMAAPERQNLSRSQNCTCRG